MNLDIIYNEDCQETMTNHIEEHSIDVILTSPPYNTARTNCDFINDTQKGRYTVRYFDYNDMRPQKEYHEWTIDIFNQFDKVLKENGVILYNISYGKHTHESFWHLISDIQLKTNFTVADCIIWKKRNAVPNTASPNKLTRICEFVFVFVRKDEYDTFNANKQVVSLSKRTNQKNYENVYNFISAKNNDGACPIHKAIYSTELCEKLLKIYAKEGDIVYDPFIGIGTTALAARNLNMNYIGSEIYKEYCDLAEEKLKENA